MKICVADNLFKGIIHKVPFFERYSGETMFLNECMIMLEPLLLINIICKKKIYFIHIILILFKFYFFFINN